MPLMKKKKKVPQVCINKVKIKFISTDSNALQILNL